MTAPGSPERPCVSVVVVNYRTPALTAGAVASVVDDPLVAEVVVVDNGSGDDSLSLLRSQFCGSGRVRVVESPTNVGFGRGINLGASHCRAPLLFLLNSDAVVTPGTVAILVRTLASDETVGVISPAVYGADGRTLQAGAYGPLPRPSALLRIGRRAPALGPMQSTEPTGWVSGVAMLLRLSDFVALGGFDPDFVMYFEDVDLCRRIGDLGKRVVRAPTASVVHNVGASIHPELSRTELFHRSKLVYLEKVGASPLQLRAARLLRWFRLRPGRTRR